MTFTDCEIQDWVIGPSGSIIAGDRWQTGFPQKRVAIAEIIAARLSEEVAGGGGGTGIGALLPPAIESRLRDGLPTQELLAMDWHPHARALVQTKSVQIIHDQRRFTAPDAILQLNPAEPLHLIMVVP
jgi:hypothetical protein